MRSTEVQDIVGFWLHPCPGVSLIWKLHLCWAENVSDCNGLISLSMTFAECRNRSDARWDRIVARTSVHFSLQNPILACYLFLSYPALFLDIGNRRQTCDQVNRLLFQRKNGISKNIKEGRRMSEWWYFILENPQTYNVQIEEGGPTSLRWYWF